MALIINEIFYSIQGESTWSGLPFTFIRLTGCNLRCRYCDTRYAYREGTEWEIDAVLDHINRLACPRITVTGGEPLSQLETPALISRLLSEGYLVTLETNGSLDIGQVDARCIKIMDIKGPSSGMQAHHRMENHAKLTAVDQVKLLVADRIDFEYARAMAAELITRIPAGQILFSPIHGRLPAAQLAEWILADKLEARLQIQLHKFLWPSVDRGV